MVRVSVKSRVCLLSIDKTRSKLPLEFYYYYESTKRELKRRLMYEYRCDERLKTKTEESTLLTDTDVFYKSRKRELKTKLMHESVR